MPDRHATPPRRVLVPDTVTHPTCCWKQEVQHGIVVTFERCIYRRGHHGSHSWARPVRWAGALTQ